MNLKNHKNLRPRGPGRPSFSVGMRSLRVSMSLLMTVSMYLYFVSVSQLFGFPKHQQLTWWTYTCLRLLFFFSFGSYRIVGCSDFFLHPSPRTRIDLRAYGCDQGGPVTVKWWHRPWHYHLFGTVAPGASFAKLYCCQGWLGVQWTGWEDKSRSCQIWVDNLCKYLIWRFATCLSQWFDMHLPKGRANIWACKQEEHCAVTCVQISFQD